MGAFLALRAKNRAFRSNLFYREAVKKDFRSNPIARATAPNTGRKSKPAKLPQAILRLHAGVIPPELPFGNSGPLYAPRDFVRTKSRHLPHAVFCAAKNRGLKARRRCAAAGKPALRNCHRQFRGAHNPADTDCA
jgi:hypothetical protein